MNLSKTKWPTNTKELSIELHSKLCINEKNWHKLKSNSDRRAAELMAGAMVQLLSGGSSSHIEDLLEQSLLWVKREIKDPGCPDH